MNMVYFSIYLCLFLFLSPVFYSFLYIGLLFYLTKDLLNRFIPKYFILFIAMVNVIVSLISLSVFSLLVYKNVRGFCVLILYPANWLALVIFWWYLQGFLCRGSCHLQTMRVLLLFSQSGFLLFLVLL